MTGLPMPPGHLSNWPTDASGDPAPRPRTCAEWLADPREAEIWISNPESVLRRASREVALAVRQRCHEEAAKAVAAGFLPVPAIDGVDVEDLVR